MGPIYQAHEESPSLPLRILDDFGVSGCYSVQEVFGRGPEQLPGVICRLPCSTVL